MRQKTKYIAVFVLLAVNTAVNSGKKREVNLFMARRGENIYKRKDGRWEGRYIKDRTLTRKAIYGYVYANKYRECQEKLVRAKTLHTYAGKKYKTCGTGKVSDFMIYWLNAISRPHVKASTFSSYATTVDKWIIPFLGNKKLESLKCEDIQFFISALTEKELSAGTVRNIYHVLYTAMKKAAEFGYIYENPCLSIKLPDVVKKEARLLTIQDQKKLEKEAEKCKNGFAILLALYTGLRVGEICALRWQDVDLDNGIIVVSQTLRRVQCHTSTAKNKTELVIGSAKSQRSARTIPLPVSILHLFKEHKKTSEGEYVFSCNGHALEPRILQYRFKILLKKAGLSDINFHALRHTFATRCLELCFDIKTLSELLGHASAKMTLDRYGHSQLEHKRTVMKTLDRLFSSSV